METLYCIKFNRNLDHIEIYPKLENSNRFKFSDLVGLILQKSKNKVNYLFTFDLTIFLDMFLKEVDQYSLKYRYFKYKGKCYSLELYDILIPNKRIILKDYYNFISDIPVQNSLEINTDMLTTLFDKVKQDFNIKINTRFILSTPSIAVKIFKKDWPEKYKLISKLNTPVDNYIRKSFFGGRNEVFKPLYVGDSYYYDVNSLYPYVMKTQKYPVGYPTYCKEDFFLKEDFNLADFYGYLDILISVDKNNKLLPILPFKFTNSTEGDLSIGTFYPHGVFRGIYFSEEIKYALKHGYKIIKIFSGYKFNSLEVLFEGFVDSLYHKRLGTDNTIFSNFYKRVLNSLYGRFAIHFENNSQYIEEEDNVVDPASESFINDFYKVKYSNIGIASAISSYARIYMHELITKYNLSTLYLDTDGIFLTQKLPSNLVSDNKELGLFRLISHNEAVYFISGKFYMYKPYNQSYRYVFRSIALPYEVYSPEEIFKTIKLVLITKTPAIYFDFRLRVIENGDLKLYAFRFYKKRNYIYSNRTKKIITKPWVIFVITQPKLIEP